MGLDFPDHVRIKHHNALEDADDNGVFPRVVRRQLFAQLRDAGLDLFLGQQNLLNVLFHSFFSLMLCISFYLARLIVAAFRNIHVKMDSHGG